MSVTTSPSRFSLLPYQLRRLIYVYSTIGIFLLGSAILALASLGANNPFTIIFTIYAIIILLLDFGIYRLKPIARTISLIVLGISAFFAGFNLIEFVLSSALNGVFLFFNGDTLLGPLAYVVMVLRLFVFPAFVFYCLYLISNEDVKNYFIYPDMVENKRRSPVKKKVETREYKSFSSALDK